LSQTVAEPKSIDAVRERILDAATEEYLEFGIRRTTVEAVARRAGVGRMTLYRRFAGKEELTEAVVLRELRDFMDELDRLMAGDGPLADQMLETFVFTVLHARENRLLARLLSTDPEAALPYLTIDGRALIETAIAFTAAHIRAAPESHGMRAAEIRRIAEASTRLAHSMVLTPGGSADSPEALRAFARQALLPLLPSA
jgi:AcrR family transcriptional regulator